MPERPPLGRPRATRAARFGLGANGGQIREPACRGRLRFISPAEPHARARTVARFGLALGRRDPTSRWSALVGARASAARGLPGSESAPERELVSARRSERAVR